MSHDDFAFDPIPGLPGRPPKGESILWQGRPDAYALLRDALAMKWVLGYFAVLVVWRVLASLASMDLGAALLTGVPMVVLAAAAVGILYLMAMWQARTTVYTITTARVAMRMGIALPVTFNIPFTKVAGADLDIRKDGSGTIALRTNGDDKVAYLIAWPHVRPWHMKDPQPALRSVAGAECVAQLLSEAFEAHRATPTITRAGEATAPAGTPDRTTDLAALAGLTTAAPVDPTPAHAAPVGTAVPAE
ncbi:MAG: photosynthetic complex putative assembly protein PuhB [Pseudomonadota bacterium]